jgi:hypothetical protein
MADPFPNLDREAIFDSIMLEMSTSDRGLSRICTENSGYPSPSTIFLWMLNSKELSDKYVRAKELQCQFIADQIIDIADVTQNGVKTVSKSTGDEITTADMLEHRRLRIDSRKSTATSSSTPTRTETAR